ncbi:MAG: hypothetical protein GY749_22300 [Desulfobacteraceae bacterium]|nr:hypothetical protein [Desulfobacteraceae bacterium]
MEARVVPIADLVSLGKWRADLHVHLEAEIKSERFKLMPLSEVVVESKTAMDPKDKCSEGFYYIGLEHIEPVTGDPIGISIVSCKDVRSRSKIFKEGDILYGRLRPYLRKCLIVEEPYTKGLCSTEFIVLKAKSEFILPLFLREILVSDKITELVTRMQGGAALPRVSSKDLLNIRIPVPPLSFQKECVAKLEQIKKQRRNLILKLKSLSFEGQNIIADVFV